MIDYHADPAHYLGFYSFKLQLPRLYITNRSTFDKNKYRETLQMGITAPTVISYHKTTFWSKFTFLILGIGFSLEKHAIKFN